MKQKVSYLKSLLLIWSVLLLGCQAEDLKESASEQNVHSPVVRKKFSEFNKLPELLSEILPSQSLAAKGTGSNSLYQFEIDSTSVTQIINNGIAYYTMAIIRKNQEAGVFENLVVFDDGNEKKAVLVKYKPDESYFSRYELNADTQFTGKFNMTELGYSNLRARSSTTTTKCFVNTHLYCTNNNPPTLAGPGCYKNEDGGAHVKSVTAINCFEVVVNTPQPYLNSTFILDPNNSGAGGGNPEAGIRIATQPRLSIIEFKFIMGLSPAQKQWWNNPSNTKAVVSILNHLNQNIYDGVIYPEAITFAKKMINYAIANRLSFEFDNTIVPNASRELNSLEELEQSLRQREISSVAIDQQPNVRNTFLGRYKFKINTLTGLRVNVKFSVSPRYHHTVTNVTSEQYGASLGEWKQSDYNVEILPNQNIRIEVVGSVTYDYTIEGFGIKFFKGIRMILVINPSDATIVSSEWYYN